MSQEVYLLTHTHRHGKDLSIWSSRHAATGALAEIVRRYWPEVRYSVDAHDEVGVHPPADDRKAIDAYFRVMGEERNGRDAESYSIEPYAVQE